MNGNIPHDTIVRPGIVMNEPVTHSHDASPWNVLIKVSNILRNPFGCFPNDLQASDKGAFRLFVVEEIRERELTRMRNKKRSFFEDIA